MGRVIDAATMVDAVRIHGGMALRRRYRTKLAMSSWKGYANLVLNRT